MFTVDRGIFYAMTDKEYAERIAQALGAEIQFWRKRRAMSRVELANAADTSETTIGRIERHGPGDISLVWRICDALGVPFAELVRRAEDSLQLSEGPSTFKVAKDGIVEPGEFEGE